MKQILTIMMLSVAIHTFGVQPNEKIERFVDVDMLKKAESPIFTKDGIILTLPPNTGHEIFLRTSLDEWSKNHYFQKSMFGVYYCRLPYMEGKKQFLYRININGYWSEDPMDQDSITDNYGNRLSVIVIPEQVTYFQSTPIMEALGNGVYHVTFRVYAPDAKQVNLLCSNLGFSSFNYKMGKTNEDYWEISLTLGKGNYSYFFNIDGIKVLDLENPQKSYDTNLGRLSAFSIR